MQKAKVPVENKWKMSEENIQHGMSHEKKIIISMRTISPN